MRRAFAIVALFGALLASCVSGGGMGTLAPAASVLTVDNQYDNAVHLWVVHSGTKERKLGIVESFSRARFLLESSDYAEGTLQLFVFAPLDGNRLLTQPVPVIPGQPVRLDLNHQGGFLYPRSAADGTSFHLSRT